MTFHLRHARESDIPALARLHVQTFNETHRRGLPLGPSYELRHAQWREAFERHDDSWFCFVVEDDHGELVGFAQGTPHDGGVPGYAGELNKIYVLQRVQRKGLGRRLLCAVASRFVERGVTSMLLFGEATNPPMVSTKRLAPNVSIVPRRVPRRLRMARLEQACRAVFMTTGINSRHSGTINTAGFTITADPIPPPPPIPSQDVSAA